MAGEQVDVVVIGAGFGGIGAAIQFKKSGFDDLVVLDRESDLGGTWHVNRYPGLAVDIPSTTYSYRFEPNPRWSRLFAPGDELKRYADHVANKYDVRRHIRFNTEVLSAVWDGDESRWHLTLADGGTLSCRYLASATGFLSQPHTPDIPGITDFAGKVIHTTAWDASHSFAGQSVGLIGTGATAVQLIPEVAKVARHLTVYQRTPIWVVPKIDFPIPKPLQRLFARVPAVQRAFRSVTDAIYELIMVTGVLHFRHFKRLNIAASDISKMLRFASIRDKQLRRKLTPDYDFGCKRPTFSNSYYRTFTKPHVTLEADGIDHIESDGIVSADGTKASIDTLVLATGFDLWDANFPAIEVIGRDGRNLGKWWRDNRFQAYQGVSIPYFPNFLCLAGPYGYSGLSYFTTTECQMRHIARLFGELRRQGATTFEITDAANDRFLDRMTQLLDDSVFYAGDCASSRSYYFNHSGEATLLRPTSTGDAVAEAGSFPLTDYTYG